MIIFGTRDFNMKKSVADDISYCEVCGLESRWELVKVWTWFTLFFLPIFPVWVKTVIRCPNCESWIKVRRDDRDEVLKNFNESQPPF